VAGCILPRGFHWDVDHQRGGGELCTTHEVWRIGAGAYVNVGPTSDVRLTKRRSRARLIWPEQALRPAASRPSRSKTRRAGRRRR
jgi:hypothetical protein